MSKQTVRVLIEEMGEVNWFASFEVKRDDVVIKLDSESFVMEAQTPDNVLTTFSTHVVLMDLARELYETYVLASGGLNFIGEPCPLWNVLPQKTRENWIAVARRATSLGALYSAPKGIDSFDASDANCITIGDDAPSLDHLSDMETPKG